MDEVLMMTKHYPQHYSHRNRKSCYAKLEKDCGTCMQHFKSKF